MIWVALYLAVGFGVAATSWYWHLDDVGEGLSPGYTIYAFALWPLVICEMHYVIVMERDSDDNGD